MNFSTDTPMTSWNDNSTSNHKNTRPIHRTANHVRRPYESTHSMHSHVTNVNHYGPSYFGNNNINFERRRQAQGTPNTFQEPRRSAKRQRPSSRHLRKPRPARVYGSRRVVRDRNSKTLKVDSNHVGPTSMSESEDTQQDLGRMESVEWQESPNNGLSLQLNAECKTMDRLMDPDLTPLDEDRSSEMSAEESNRWHLPLTDDDAVISNEDSVDLDEMSVSTHRESKKRRVDSGSRSLHSKSGKSGRDRLMRSGHRMKQKMMGNVAEECMSMTPMQSVEDQPEQQECEQCAARQSDVLHVGGVHVSGLDMTKLMALEGQLLTALCRVQQAMASQYESEKLCVVCKQSPKDTVFRPCSHLSTCYDCAKKLDKCPLCRHEVHDKFKVIC